jgi:hypothetical protein
MNEEADLTFRFAKSHPTPTQCRVSERCINKDYLQQQGNNLIDINQDKYFTDRFVPLAVVLAHEVGHFFGFDHSNVFMYEYISETYEDPPGWNRSKESQEKRDGATGYISAVGPLFLKNVRSRIKKPTEEVSV